MEWQRTLLLLPDVLAVCRLGDDTRIPSKLPADRFISVTRTRDETPMACPEADLPYEAPFTGGRRCVKVEGPLAPGAVVGVLAALGVPLAGACIGNFVMSTYATDDLLIQHNVLDRAVAAPARRGHRVLELTDGDGADGREHLR